MFGSHGVDNLLVFSQVVLSLQLSFAVFPLVQFTSTTNTMGKEFVNSWFTTILSCCIAILIAGLNAYLVVTFFKGLA